MASPGDCARRRISERNRRKAALSAKMKLSSESETEEECGQKCLVFAFPPGFIL